MREMDSWGDRLVAPRLGTRRSAARQARRLVACTLEIGITAAGKKRVPREGKGGPGGPWIVGVSGIPGPALPALRPLLAIQRRLGVFPGGWHRSPFPGVR